MQYFIGIVPAENFKKKVTDFRGKWKNNLINEVVEPHITLKAQGGLTPDEKWISKVKRVCGETRPFHIKIEKPMFFGEEILFFSASSEQLYTLHKDIVHAVEPSKEQIERYFKLENFVPHMTLGKTTLGLPKRDLKDMATLAQTEMQPYPTLNVTFVRVYKEIEPNHYVKLEDIPLAEK
ncbi:2'-5' RNA ligase family protein [Salinibacillus aidingensis]